MADVVLSTREDKLKLNGMVEEIVQAWVKKKDLDSFVKDVKTRAKEELGVEGKTVADLARERMEDKITERHGDDELVIELNEELENLAKEARKA